VQQQGARCGAGATSQLLPSSLAAPLSLLVSPAAVAQFKCLCVGFQPGWVRQ